MPEKRSAPRRFPVFGCRLLLCTVLLGVAGSAFPAQAPVSSRTGEARQLLEAAREAERSGELRRALTLFLDAVRLQEEIQGADHVEVALSLSKIAWLRRTLGEYNEALALYLRALAILEKTFGSEHVQVAVILNGLAWTHKDMGEYATALPMFNRALAILEKAGEDRNLAAALNNLGLLYRLMAEYDKALAMFQRSLAIREKVLGSDHLDVAESLNNLALVYRNTGKYALALPLYNRSIAITEMALGPHHLELASTLNNLAALHWAMGEYANAAPLFRRGLAIEEKSLGPGHPQVARSLGNLGVLYRSMGDFAVALPLSQRSLAVSEQALGVKHPDTARALNNLGWLYHDMGEYGRALPLFARSLATSEETLGPMHPEVAQTLNNQALLMKSMGEHAKALPLLQRSLAISEKSLGPEHPQFATALNNLATLLQDLGQHANARPLLERSLAISEKSLGPEHPHVATALNNLASLYHDTGGHAQALHLHHRSLAIQEKSLGPGHPETAITLNNMAWLHRDLGEHDKALPLYQRALVVASNANAPEVVWRVQNGLRAVFTDLKRPELATFFGKQAVNTIQGLRGGIAGLDRELQQSFLEDKVHVYRGLADLLIQQGRLAEAQQVLGMLKEEEFFDFIRRSAGDDPRRRRVEFLPHELPWHERLQQLIAGLGTVGAALADLERRARIGDTSADGARIAALQQERAAAYAAFDNEFRSFLEKFAEAPRERQGQGASAIADLAALQRTLAELGPGTVIVHYAQGEQRLNLIVTSSTRQVARQTAVPAGELDRKIRLFRTALNNPAMNPRPMAEELNRILIAPIAQDLAEFGTRTVMLYLDGTLRYIPFAALHDGKQYLIERYGLALYTEVARESLAHRPGGAMSIAGLGLTQAIEDFQPLPAVRAELEAIVKSGERGVVPGDLYLDQQFNAEAIHKALGTGRPLLHIASHFVFRPGTEASSFLLLGDGDRLTLSRIKQDKFNFSHLDLITLSACETGLGGGRNAQGQEIEGFGTLVQKLGAKGVVATLWPVADESTALLMQTFYRLREERNLSKAEALRQAQVALIRGVPAERAVESAPGSGTSGIPVPIQRQNYGHPFFWAPFILMGNWL